MENIRNKGNRSNARKQGGRKPLPRMVPYRREDKARVINGQLKVFKATPAREIVRRLASDLAVELMRADRERTLDVTPNGRKYSILPWELPGKIAEEGRYLPTTAALRWIEAQCYGTYDRRSKKDRDWSVLTDLQLKGLQGIFMLVVAFEMQEGNSLHRTGVQLPGMSDDLDWYVEGIDDALDLLDESRDSQGKPRLGVALKLWLTNVRSPDLKAAKLEVADARAEAIDAWHDAKKVAEAESPVEDAKMTDEDFAEALAEDAPELTEALSS